MLKKNNNKPVMKNHLFGLILLTLLSSSIANACSCSGNGLSIEERYNQADGIYFAVITSVATIENIDENSLSNTKVEIELTVYKTYKGEKISTLLATGGANLPIIDYQGKLVLSSSSCDVPYFVGKEYTLITYDDENIDLGMCSDNIFNMEYLDKTEIELFYKLTESK